jgi:hypothetical protein
MVTIQYADGEKFGRVYTSKEKADRFAERQRRSPVVKSVRVSQVSWKILQNGFAAGLWVPGKACYK